MALSLRLENDMNYRAFAEYILAQPEPVQNQDVTIFVPGVDEYYPAAIAFTDDSCDMLDDGHMVIVPSDDSYAEAEHRANYPNS